MEYVVRIKDWFFLKDFGVPGFITEDGEVRLEMIKGKYMTKEEYNIHLNDVMQGVGPDRDTVFESIEKYLSE